MQPRPKSATYRARRVHRWLGLFIGIQFVLWTVGGLYFSWTSIDAVHGDHLMRMPGALPADEPLASPSVALAALRQRAAVDSIAAIELGAVLGRPVYHIEYHASEGGRPVRRRALADAVTGAPRAALGREEAIESAQRAYTGSAPVTRVEYLTGHDVGRHHEYREQPLPAWAVHFGDDEGATAYVAAELGRVVRIRNERWRAYDFLWMLHTMDYAGRDDFNNAVLRAFSILGLSTVTSGFVLFVLTSGFWRARRRRAVAVTALVAGD